MYHTQPMAGTYRNTTVMLSVLSYVTRLFWVTSYDHLYCTEGHHLIHWPATAKKRGAVLPLQAKSMKMGHNDTIVTNWFTRPRKLIIRIFKTAALVSTIGNDRSSLASRRKHPRITSFSPFDDKFHLLSSSPYTKLNTLSHKHTLMLLDASAPPQPDTVCAIS